MKDVKPFVSHKEIVKIIAEECNVAPKRVRRIINKYFSSVLRLSTKHDSVAVGQIGVLKPTRNGTLINKREKIVEEIKKELKRFA